jgi:hypothetical protein
MTLSAPTTGTEPCVLSDQQLTSFETFGYLYLPGVFGHEIADIEAGFEELAGGGEWDVVRCDRYYDASRTGCDESPRLMRVEPIGHPGLSWLGDDRRVGLIVSQLLGEECEYTGSQASLFNCDTNWHHDGLFTLGAGRHLLLMIAIDALDRDTGALRVIPGSHAKGAFRDALRASLTGASCPTEEVFGLDPDQLPAQVLAVEPGDVVVIDYDIAHASFGGGMRRRALTLSYGPAGMAHRREELLASSQ